MKKKNAIITFISVATLLALFDVNDRVVHADTIRGGVDTIATTNKDNSTDTNQTKVDNKSTNKAVITDTADDKNEQKGHSADMEQDKQPAVDTKNNNTESNSSYNQSYDTSYYLNNTYQDQYQLNNQAMETLTLAGIDPSSLTENQRVEINKIDFNAIDKDGSTKWTYDEYSGVAKKMLSQDTRYRVPYFNAKKIKNMPATVTRDAQTGKKAELEIWDSWPVQNDKTGKVFNYKGYQLMIAMMGIPNDWKDGHIYLLYNKYNDNNFNHWKCAGPIFGYKATPVNQEWSGSATVNKDGSIQLFYADVDTSEGTNHQKISTVNLKLKVNKKKNIITIAKRSNRHVLFEGDGYWYQTYKQWKDKNKGADNTCMRDAHVISVKGKRYLIFEASTGMANYQGADQVYKWQNYGGTAKENIENFLKVTADEDMTSRATWANAAIGILRLGGKENNPKVAEVLPPLVTSLMVSDEIERPNIIPMNGRYYLFATTRLNHGTADDLWKKADAEIGDNVAMLGWVSDHLTYGYKPLNGDAAVLVGSVPFNWRTSTYSYYAVPVNGKSNEVLVTSYMTNRGWVPGPGKRSTMAPAFLVKINGETTEVEQVATNQGDWVYDKKSRNKSMVVDNIADAHLDGEPIEHSLLKKA